MKSHLAKLSLALLSTVFLLGCQEQGSSPVGPEGLGPEFSHKPGKAHGGNKGDPQVFDVTLTGDVFFISRTVPSTSGLLLKDITLDLSFFGAAISGCNLEEETGDLALQEGSEGESGHAFLLFHFRHNVDNNEIRHSLEMDATINNPANWPPATGTSNSMIELPKGNGHWQVKASGRNHQNGCKGEGGGPDFDGPGKDLDFRATVVPVS